MPRDPVRSALASELGKSSWKARKRKFGRAGAVDILREAGRKGAEKRWGKRRKLSTGAA